MAYNPKSEFVQSSATFYGTNASGTIASNALSVSVSPSTNYIFSNGNGVSFGTAGSTVTATVKTDYQTSGNYLTTAALSNQVVNSINGSTGIFSFNTGSSLSSSRNGNSITCGLASNIATALQSTGNYLTTAAQSTQTNAFSLGGNTGTTNSSVLSAGGYVIAGGSNITLSMSNNSLSIHAQSQSVQTQSRFNLTLSGNSTSGGAGYQLISSGVMTLAGGNNITISQDGNALTISGPNVGGAQTGISGLVASNATYTSGTVSFRDGNGISFASTTGQQISITHGLQYSSNMTDYQSTGAYLTTAAQSTQTMVMSLGGNVATTNSSRISAGGYILAGGNGVTIQQSNNTVSLSVATNYQSQGAYLTTARASTDAVGLNTALTANGVSWTVNSSGISLNVPAFLTTAAQSTQTFLASLGGNSGTTNSSRIGNGGFVFAGGNGVTINQSNNSVSWSVATNYQSQGAYLTTARASTDAIGLNTAQSNVTWTANSSGLSLDARGYAGTGTTFNGTNVTATIVQNSLGLNLSLSAGAGGAGVVLSGSNNSITSGTASFVNANGVSWSFNGQSISASVKTDYLTTQTNQNVSLYALGNTTQNSSTLLNASNLSFNGLGAMSWGYSNGSIQVSAPAISSLSGGPFITISTNGSTISIIGASVGAAPISISAGTSSANLSSVIFSDSNRVSFGLNGSTITAKYALNFSGGTTSQNISDQIIFSNSNGVSFGLNGSTITASVSQAALNLWDNMGILGVGVAGSSGTINIATKGTVQNSVHIFPIGVLPGTIAPSTVFLQMSHSASGNSSTGPKVFTISLGLYTRNASTLSLLNSASTAISLAANAANSTGYSGIRWISIHSSQWSVAPTFSQDVEYYGAMVYSTGGNNSLAQTAGFLGFYPFMTAANSGVFGVSQTTASTQGFYPWLGIFSSTGVIPTNIQVSEITKQGASANFVPHIVLNNLNSYY